MCIAILNIAGTIDEEMFMNCWMNNPDGTGMAYVRHERIKVIKEMDDPASIYQRYLDIRRGNNRPIILHFRIATSGAIDLENCHPFEIRPGLVMAHNGILDQIEADPRLGLNDTRVFINQVLKELPKGYLENTGIRRLLTDFVGNSKLVFLDRHGRYDIINEELGHWDQSGENWFSNYSYRYDPGYEDLANYFKRTRSYLGHGDRFEANSDDWEMCESCENWVHGDEIIYDRNLGALICQDCLEYYFVNGMCEDSDSPAQSRGPSLR